MLFLPTLLFNYFKGSYFRSVSAFAWMPYDIQCFLKQACFISPLQSAKLWVEFLVTICTIFCGNYLMKADTEGFHWRSSLGVYAGVSTIHPNVLNLGTLERIPWHRWRTCPPNSWWLLLVPLLSTYLKSPAGPGNMERKRRKPWQQTSIDWKHWNGAWI